jgi:hypothetical protein
MSIETSKRHPSTQQIARWFSWGHLPLGEPRNISMDCGQFAQAIIDQLPDGPELTAGLRHLLEAKDCFVRAAIAGEE